MKAAIIGAFICVATGFFNSMPAAADTVPLCGLLCFHSADSARVSVTMAHELQPERQVHLSIPRSAVVFVSGYDPLKNATLPNDIATNGPWLQFALVAPDGLPIGEAVTKYEQSNGVTLDGAATRLRPDYAIVQLSVVGRGISNEQLFSAWLPASDENAVVRAVEPFDGLPAQLASYPQSDGLVSSLAVDGTYTTYFPSSDQDPFFLIRCETRPDPVHWCTYQMRPNDLVKLEVRMSDFRVYGGREFVQDRLNMITSAYCDYDLACAQ